MTPEMRAAIETPRMVYWWGRDHLCSPKVVERIFGDGQKLAFFAPTGTRPNYYVLQMDSAWTPDRMRDPVGEGWMGSREFLDEVYDAVQDEFGFYFDDDEEDGEPEYGWPMLDLNYGCSWGEYNSPRLELPDAA